MAAKNLNPDDPRQADVADVPTLAGLVDKAALAEPRAVVELVLDGSGPPRSLAIDHRTEAMDDEECYEVSALRVVD